MQYMETVEMTKEKVTFSFGKNWENFIRLNFGQIKNPDTKYLINQIPTSLTLTNQEVDMVIAPGLCWFFLWRIRT